jgi:soluble lytic murein transglycosylase-like protein
MYGFDPALLEAISFVESHGDPDAISGKGAMGLMQLMPLTASRFKVANPLDPIESVLGAARFLDYLNSQQIGGRDLPKLLAAYNAGEGAVKRFHGIPPYAETREYVRAVLWLYLLAEPPAGKGQNKRAIQDLVEPKTTVSHENTSDDRALLEQLANLRHQRDAAREAR